MPSLSNTLALTLAGRGQVMTAQADDDVSRLLLAWQAGDEGGLERLLPLVYAELREIAHRQLRNEPNAITLQPTALVHEAYLRLVGADFTWAGRTHFLAVAARTMRRILVDQARRRRADRRGSGAVQVTMPSLAAPQADPIDLLAIDEALVRLAAQDERKARVVELRHFAGLTLEEIAEVLELSIATVHRELRFATSWLAAELSTE
ncbi:MAG: ECF-type sigma factor [Gemmatimonadaceae bacterium]|jgi:RNA polymerase sigma factor (TIGR02999 family)|nr:ECF-type sigma factor [Gemmatimonadaceae bacterium]